MCIRDRHSLLGLLLQQIYATLLNWGHNDERWLWTIGTIGSSKKLRDRLECASAATLVASKSGQDIVAFIYHDLTQQGTLFTGRCLRKAQFSDKRTTLFHAQKRKCFKRPCTTPWIFFFQSPKGKYAKELKKNKGVNRFHRIGPPKKKHKIQKKMDLDHSKYA